VTNISQSFTYETAAKINWYKYGTKLRHCHSLYISTICIDVAYCYRCSVVSAYLLVTSMNCANMAELIEQMTAVQSDSSSSDSSVGLALCLSVCLSVTCI